VLALAAPAAVPAGAEVRSAWTQVGILTCIVNSNIGFIIAGHQSMKCEFQQAESDPPQVYQGSNSPQLFEGAVNTIGLDAGVTDGGVLGWTVLASTEGLLPGTLVTTGVPVGALAGEYVGTPAILALSLLRTLPFLSAAPAAVSRCFCATGLSHSTSYLACQCLNCAPVERN
jgi:hypothetical protein